jgi:CheY-like chemotaxis protein
MVFMRTENPVRIVVVDDHPNTATMLARVLSRFDSPVEVLTASGAEEAIQQIGDQGVDILITDFMMPGINGLELIEKLGAEKRPAQTILITAYDTPGLAISARRLGVKNYLVKPVQPEKIRQIVQHAIDDLRPAVASISQLDQCRSFKILVADDNPDNLRLLNTRLQNEGFEFVPAWDGEETINKIKAVKPDLVLLDVNMPKKDGFQVLEEIRTDPELAHIPIIVITAARIGPKDVRDGLRIGADDYVIKPFDWRELAARIHSKLRVKQAEDLLRQKNQELGLLPRLTQALSSEKTVEQKANAIISQLVQCLGIQGVWIEIYLHDGTLFRSEYKSENLMRNVLNEAELRTQMKYLHDEIVSKQESILIQDAGKDAEWKHLLTGHSGSVVSIPIKGQKKFLGVITIVDPRAGFFTADHLILFEAVGCITAMNVDNIYLQEAEKHLLTRLLIMNEIIHELQKIDIFEHCIYRMHTLIQEKLGYHTVCIAGINDLKDNTYESLETVENLHDYKGEKLTEIRDLVRTTGKTFAIVDSTATDTVIASPIYHNERVEKVLFVIGSENNTLLEADRILVENICNQLNSLFNRIELGKPINRD